jgi:hypothetical protein
MRTRPLRRVLSVAFVVAGLAAGASLAPANAKLPIADIRQSPKKAILDLTGHPDQTVPTATPDPLANGIGPGSHLLMEMAGGLYGCTANFVWKDSSTGKLYLGAAGHCFLPEGTVATAGPGADYNPAQTSVRVCVSGCYFGGESGFSIQGTTVALGPVAYSRQTQGGVDVGNDFGVVEIPSALYSLVRNNVPVWGGPTSVKSTTVGDSLCLYGNGVGLGEVFATKARAGISEGGTATYWAGAIPSSPGDSGSAVETCTGAAIGLLTHIAPGYGGIVGTTVGQAKSMATQAGLNLVLQTA